MRPDKIKRALKNKAIVLKEILRGMTTYDLTRSVKKQMAFNEYALMLVMFGDMLGYPVSSYYRFRMLPHVVQKIGGWKRFMLEEKLL